MAGELPEYLAWCRQQPCSACDRRPPSEAHHRTGAGMGLRAHDDQAFPLCRVCHRDLHSASGIFRQMSKAEKKLWQQEKLEVARERYLEVTPKTL